MANLAALHMINVGFMQFVMEAEEEYEALRDRERRRRTCWVRNWLSPDRRLAASRWSSILQQLPQNYPSNHWWTPFTTKEDTSYRKAIKPGMKLAITLRHLATGDCYAAIQYDFRVSKNTELLVNESCLWKLGTGFEEWNHTSHVDSDTWPEIGEEFKLRWNVQHASGALDRKMLP